MSIFDAVGAVNPGRTMFDLSHTKLCDANIGQLVPLLCEEVLPGDVFNMSVLNTIRAQPLVAPIYHKLDCYFHVFFVPNRIVWDDFEEFITGGVTGDSTISIPTFGNEPLNVEGQFLVDRYGMWDYLGLPIHVPSTGVPSDSMEITTDSGVIDLPWRAFWAIWRDYYRDSNHMLYYPSPGSSTPVEIGQGFSDQLDSLDSYMDSYSGTYVPECDTLPYRCWTKDYFTSALPFQQRGTAPVVPIVGSGALNWDNGMPFDAVATPLSPVNVQVSSSLAGDTGMLVPTADAATMGNHPFDGVYVDLDGIGLTTSDMRLTVQLQRYMEASARGGYRYNEFLGVHFGVKTQDFRLQRPEYIGGSKQPIIISEVLQTSESGTDPLGTMGGHGMGVDHNFQGKYRANEHGYIIGVMSIVPEALYQQGIDRQFTKETRFDYYSPEFAHLSEMEIKEKELFFSDNVVTDNTRFGFQSCWDEYRTRQSKVCGKLASSLNYWHLSRIFDAPPALNSAFLTYEELSKNRRDAWAVPG
jgi:hypothetical protein